ncbi:MAG: branched-chain amino acid ABC transporter permease [Acidimicrobiaceae bacterium]|nr:branched-chain amino acid ABC transporter permease [Acidimicrobiaceae bacterium]
MPPPVHVKSQTVRRRTGVDIFLLIMKVAMSGFVILGFLMFIGQQIDPNNFIASRINPDATGLTAAQFEGLIISGLSQGAMYGLIALGYSMVYGVLGFINFAHGEVFMVGAMTGMITSNKFDDAGLWESNFLLSLAIVLLIAIICSTLTAVTMERVAYRRLRGSPRLIPLITSIGVSFFLQNVSIALLGPRAKTYPALPDWLSKKRELLGFISIDGPRLLVLIVATVAMLALWFLIEKTRTGKAMRAVAEDKEIASLMGINVNRTIVTTFAVGGAMAGVAGILWGLLFRSVTAVTGFLPGIKAFSAAVVGGIGNMGGAMAGGVTLGGAESVAPLVLLEPWGINGVSQLKDAVAFLVLIFVLLVKPTGLFGERLSSEDRA